MERKIGERFEYNGEWYQCIKGIGCFQCVFNRTLCVRSNISRDIIGNCSKNTREDGYAVIFKKLEKVGEPYYNNEKKLCQQYKCYINPLVTDEIVYVFADNKVVIEIKQTKEDMEEKKLNLKPFDIQKAREGKPVCTRDGRRARIICFDGKGDQPIIALVEAKGNKDALIEKVERYFINGYSVFEIRETNNDLMMLPEKKEGWVNVYQGGKLDANYLYPSKEDAVENIFQPMKDNYIDTIKLTWEE